MDVMREPSDKNKTASLEPKSPNTVGNHSESQEKILHTLSKYQEMYNRDPDSKIFAPLAEAYRKSGRLEHAYEIALKGISTHPEFASGQVTLARILIDMGEFSTAIDHLKLATEMSPDNFLAHKLLGETHIALKQPTKALQVFKMALYLDPLDSFAKKMVKKLESLSAADFTDDSIFSETTEVKLTESAHAVKTAPTQYRTLGHELDRYVSLIDAYISRNDYDRASSTLKEGLDKLGKSPELQRRQLFLSQRFEDSSQKISDIDTVADQQVKVLRRLLGQIEDRRIY